jgi:hypothetical protein
MTKPTGSPGPLAAAVVVDRTYNLVLWLIQKVRKFPKSTAGETAGGWPRQSGERFARPRQPRPLPQASRRLAPPRGRLRTIAD